MYIYIPVDAGSTNISARENGSFQTLSAHMHPELAGKEEQSTETQNATHAATHLSSRMEGGSMALQHTLQHTSPRAWRAALQHTLRRTAPHCNIHSNTRVRAQAGQLRGIATHYNTLRRSACPRAWRAALQHTVRHAATHLPASMEGGSMALQHTLQRTAPHCNIHCNTPVRVHEVRLRGLPPRSQQ